MLNKALRQQNIDLLFTFRFLIRDLSRQLTELKQKQYTTTELLQLYRGQIMSKNEFNQLRAAIGHIISMNSFLSTSTNRELANEFVIDRKIEEESQVRVLFEIVADTHRADTRPFANISELSSYPSEEEVLFMAGSVFRLVDILDEEEKGMHMHIIKLRLCGDNDNQLRDVFTSMKDEIGQETNLLSLGNILQEMGEFNRAAHFYRCLLTQLPTDSFNVAVCYYSLGSIAHTRGEYDEALQNYEHLLKQLPCSPQLARYQPDFVGLVYNAMGAAYESKDELDNAVKHYQQALDLLDQNNSLDAAAAFGNLGNVYRKQNKFDLALAKQQTCLQVNRYAPISL
jgi:tetratricopeptide (TPR) repeat protein